MSGLTCRAIAKFFKAHQSEFTSIDAVKRVLREWVLDGVSVIERGEGRRSGVF